MCNSCPTYTHPCTNVTQYMYSLSHLLCQINTDGDKQIYEPINALTRNTNSSWNVKHVLCQFHLATQKFNVRALKKADRGAIILQVKNWITSWAIYCEKNGEKMTSFALFTAFMDRSDVKQ
jgi:hypothetical protein